MESRENGTVCVSFRLVRRADGRRPSWIAGCRLRRRERTTTENETQRTNDGVAKKRRNGIFPKMWIRRQEGKGVG